VVRGAKELLDADEEKEGVREKTGAVLELLLLLPLEGLTWLRSEEVRLFISLTSFFSSSFRWSLLEEDEDDEESEDEEAVKEESLWSEEEEEEEEAEGVLALLSVNFFCSSARALRLTILEL
jgi:hypothetical protein